MLQYRDELTSLSVQQYRKSAAIKLTTHHPVLQYRDELTSLSVQQYSKSAAIKLTTHHPVLQYRDELTSLSIQQDSKSAAIKFTVPQCQDKLTSLFYNTANMRPLNSPSCATVQRQINFPFGYNNTSKSAAVKLTILCYSAETNSGPLTVPLGKRASGSVSGLAR